MIVDTSAVVSILFDESDADVYDKAIASAPRSRMSVVNFIEATIVVEGRSGEVAGQDLDDYCQNAPIELEPVTIDQMEAARPSLAKIRQRKSSCRPEFWGLLCLCACENG